MLNMSTILRNLNTEQYDAVTSFDKYLRVIAGAGSGKTRVLTCRVAYLIEEMGVLPRSILAITFTNKAAREMKSRVDDMLSTSTNGFGYLITTFHSFCARFLREEIQHIDYPNNYVIMDEDDQIKVVKDIMKEMEVSDDFKPKSVVSYISFTKTCGISPKEALEKAKDFVGETIKAKIYAKYEEYLTSNFYLDFDDLIIKTVEILKKFPRVKEKWNEKYEHILVDEFQDTNDIQYELLTLILGEHCSLFVVGDPDQTIYTWRGANVDLIMDFKKRFQPSRDIVLKKNYRSTKNILACANALIRNNKKRVEKDLITDNYSGAKVIKYEAQSTDKEASWVVQRINELLRNNEELTYSDFAILYRSNYYSRAFEQCLVNYRIPYVIYGGMKFFERKEVKDSIAYLRLALKEDDALAFERIINVPRRGIGDKALQDIKDGAKERNCSMYKYCVDVLANKNLKIKDFVRAIENCKEKLADSNEENFGDILKDLMEKSGYLQSLRDEKESERIENIEELANYLFSLQSTHDNFSLAEALQEITLYSAQDEMEDKNMVTLMTVHTAKGLEYPFVFVVGMSEGVFPSARSISGGDGFMENKDAIEEERRLAYVACTRAKKQLFLSSSLGYSYASGGYMQASRFIHEIGEAASNYYLPSNKPNYDFNKTYLNKKTPYKSQAVLKDNDTSFRPGELVNHSAYGNGIIIGVEANAVRIAFKDPNVGQKLISKKFTGLKKV